MGPSWSARTTRPVATTLRRTAARAAEAAGLGDLLEDARRRFADWVQAAFSRTRSDLKAIQWVAGTSLGPTADRVDVLAAVDDAVLGTVARGLIAETDRVELLEPYARLVSVSSRPTADHPD